MISDDGTPTLARLSEQLEKVRKKVDRLETADQTNTDALMRQLAENLDAATTALMKQLSEQLGEQLRRIERLERAAGQ